MNFQEAAAISRQAQTDLLTAAQRDVISAARFLVAEYDRGQDDFASWEMLREAIRLEAAAQKVTA